MDGPLNAISRSAAPAGSTGPLTLSPRHTMDSTPWMAISASTASRACALPWTSEMTAKRKSVRFGLADLETGALLAEGIDLFALHLDQFAQGVEILAPHQVHVRHETLGL